MEALDETVRQFDSELSAPRSPEISTSRLSSCMSPIANTDQSLPPTIDKLDRVDTQLHSDTDNNDDDNVDEMKELLKQIVRLYKDDKTTSESNKARLKQELLGRWQLCVQKVLQ